LHLKRESADLQRCGSSSGHDIWQVPVQPSAHKPFFIEVERLENLKSLSMRRLGSGLQAKSSEWFLLGSS